MLDKLLLKAFTIILFNKNIFMIYADLKCEFQKVHFKTRCISFISKMGSVTAMPAANQ